MKIRRSRHRLVLSFPSSASAPVAEQLRSDPTTTPEVGDMTAEVMVGAVFSTVTLAEALTEEPAEVSCGCCTGDAGTDVGIGGGDRVGASRAHSGGRRRSRHRLVSMIRHPHRLADVEQVNVLPTTTPEAGEMLGVEMVGVLFSTLALIEEDAVEPSESVALAVHVIVDPTLTSEAETV